MSQYLQHAYDSARYALGAKSSILMTTTTTITYLVVLLLEQNRLS